VTRALAGLLVAAGLLSAPPAPRAIEQPIDDPSLSQAIVLARRGGAELDAFHRRYVTIVGDNTYDRVEIISEFRRAVLIAAEQMKIDSRWDVNKARPALEPYRAVVSLVLWIKFPPQNMLVSAPDYGIVVYPDGVPSPGMPDDEIATLAPDAQQVTPLFLAGGGSTFVAPPGSGMSGLRVEAAFPSVSLPAGTVTIGLRLEGKRQRVLDLDLRAVR